MELELGAWKEDAVEVTEIFGATLDPNMFRPGVVEFMLEFIELPNTVGCEVGAGEI